MLTHNTSRFLSKQEMEKIQIYMVLPVFAWMIAAGSLHKARVNGETKSIRSNRLSPWSDGAMEWWSTAKTQIPSSNSQGFGCQFSGFRCQN